MPNKTTCSENYAIRRPTREDWPFIRGLTGSVSALPRKRYIVLSSKDFERKAVVTVKGTTVNIHLSSGRIFTYDDVAVNSVIAEKVILMLVEKCV